MITEDQRKKLIEISTAQKKPVYVYFESLLQKTFSDFESSLPEDIKIFYSMKANPLLQIAKSFRKLGALVDVSSSGELQTALTAGFQPEQISFVGPGKSESEISECLKHHILIVVESLEELEKVFSLAGKSKDLPPISLRLCLPKIKTPSGRWLENSPSQFGMDAREAEQALKLLSEKDFLSVGFHGHHLSGYLDVEVVRENYFLLLTEALKWKRKFNLEVHSLNFGGGLGFPDYDNQNAVDLKKYSEIWKDLKASSEFIELQHPQLMVESGRYLLRGCGFYLTKVIYRKRSYDKDFLIVDGGFHHFMAATGFGYFPRRHFKVEALNPASQETSKFQIAGKTCFQMDLIAEEIELPLCRGGETLCVHHAGAYGYSFSPLEFLSHEKPEQVYVET